MFKYKKLSIISAVLVLMNVVLGGVYLVLQQSTSGSQAGVLGVNDGIPIFSKELVLNNSTFSSTRVFNSQSSIQSYLDRVNSPLKDYSDQGKSASYWIWNASQGVTSSKYGVTPRLNPGMLLAFLEKEQSLLSRSDYDTANDPERRIRTAMGYGCPDFAECDTQYFGLANQLNWSSYQLQYNFNRAGNSNSNTPYKVNNTISTLDEYSVLLSNEATASVYNYTPHVYWGNYNLWKIITANGWGTSSQTYDAQEIDRVNIYEKDIDPDDIEHTVSFEQVKDILNKDFKIGDQSDEVELIQQYLRQEGYYTYLFITGYYGTITDNALQNYRADQVAGVKPAPETAPEPSPEVTTCDDLYDLNWTIGQNGDEVVKLQECLREEGVFNYSTSTGYFGPITEKALQDYRASKSGEVATEVAPAPESIDRCEELRVKSWQIGDVSGEVRELQSCMRERGFFAWPYGDTGYFGPVTLDALTRWSAALNPKPVDRCDQLRDQSWEFGAVNNEVRELQQCMKDRGFFTWPYITNYFGPVTNEALNNWRGNTAPIFECSSLKEQEWVTGEVSERVRQLQACMRSAGTFNWAGGNTGYFGSATESALISWRGYF